MFVAERSEQRATQVLIGVTMGLSVFLVGIFKYIPMAVLYGVFLYMGITSLGGLQVLGLQMHDTYTRLLCFIY